MNTLRNLRFLADLGEMTHLSIGRILDNTSNNVILEYEKLIKKRQMITTRAEKKAEKEAKKEAGRIRREEYSAFRMRIIIRTIERQRRLREERENKRREQASKREENRLNKIGKCEDGEKECFICYEIRMCVFNYKCPHSFCKNCLVHWTKGCPICRSNPL